MLTDAHVAILAIGHGASMATADPRFRRFPGLRIVDLTAASPHAGTVLATPARLAWHSAHTMKPILVTIETTPRKTFATAADWPGWIRSGKTEALALEALVAYVQRYATVVAAEHRRFTASPSLADLEVVERHDGSAGTEFGLPSRPTEHDARPTDADSANRQSGLVGAAWATFDRAVRAAPEELRKGPRGGGRNTSTIVAHVMAADRAYAGEIGIKVGEFPPDDRAAARAMREAMLEVIRAARDGEPLAGKRWPARYAAHRIAWHALDHAWEIEDRSAPAEAALG